MGKKGIAIYTKEGTIKTFSYPDSNFLNSIFQQQNILINSMFTVNDHYLFLYDGKSEIVQLNLQNRQLSFLKTGPLFSLACDQQHLYVTTNTGLKNINIQTGRTVKVFSLTTILNERLNNSSIVLTDNNQLLLSLNKHLYQLDTSFNNINEITNLSSNPVISVGIIRMIYPDKYKRIWLLTNDDIKRIQNVDIPFDHLLYANEKNNFVRSIYYDKKKNILLAGCYDGGVQLYDSTGSPLWQRALSSEKVKDIIAIEKLTEDDYLVITLGQGWYILNVPAKQIQAIKLSGDFENTLHTNVSNFANNMQRIDDSTIFYYNPGKRFKCVFKNVLLKSAQPLLPFFDHTSNSINCFIYTSDKALWVSTSSGIIYRLEKDKSLYTLHIRKTIW